MVSESDSPSCGGSGQESGAAATPQRFDPCEGASTLLHTLAGRKRGVLQRFGWDVEQMQLLPLLDATPNIREALWLLWYVEDRLLQAARPHVVMAVLRGMRKWLDAHLRAHPRLTGEDRYTTDLAELSLLLCALTCAEKAPWHQNAGVDRRSITGVKYWRLLDGKDAGRGRHALLNECAERISAAYWASRGGAGMLWVAQLTDAVLLAEALLLDRMSLAGIEDTYTPNTTSLQLLRAIARIERAEANGMFVLHIREPDSSSDAHVPETELIDGVWHPDY